MIDSPPISITSQLAREPLPVTGEQQIAYLLVELCSTEALPTTRHPVNIALVLDRSGSMRGPSMHYLKEGICQLIDHLGPEDILTVVAFDDLVDLIIPAQPVIDKDSLKGTLSLLEDGGGTAVSLGMSLGLTELSKHVTPECISCMFLLVDGVTRGDELQCVALARNAAEMGITIDTFGCGAEWDDAFLEMLSEQTGGAAPEYIRSPVEIGPAFLRRVDAARATMVTDVKATMKCVAGVTPRHVTRIAPFLRLVDTAIHERTIALQLGTLDADIPQSFLIEMLIEPKRGGTFRIAQMTTSFAGPTETPLHADIVVTFSGSATKRPKIRPVVLHYVERATAARIVLRALADEHAARPPLARGVLQLFDTESRAVLEHFWRGTPLSPEARKMLYAKVRQLTMLRRARPDAY